LHVPLEPSYNKKKKEKQQAPKAPNRNTFDN
jgi:hypothetical protein